MKLSLPSWAQWENLRTIKIRRWWVVATIALVLGGYFAYTKWYAPADNIYSDDENYLYKGGPLVVGTGDLKRTITFDGRTAFSNAQKLTFGQSDLKVTKVFVEVGDTVRPGQVLATLDTSELDSQLRNARANLEIVKKKYEKTKTSSSVYYDTIQAENELRAAKIELSHIDEKNRIANMEEDMQIEKAREAVAQAQKNVDSLNCDDRSCLMRDTTIRKKRETYQNAVDLLRSEYYSQQNLLEKLDKLMLFTTKYVSWTGVNPAIGAKDVNLINDTRRLFDETSTQLTNLLATYEKLSTIDVDSLTVTQLEQAYKELNLVADLMISLGMKSRLMFNASLIDAGLPGTHEVLDNEDLTRFLNEYADPIYNAGRTLSKTAKDTIFGIYDLDDTSTFSSAQQKLLDAQIALDKLLLNKANRDTNNQKAKVAAQLAVFEAEKKLNNLKNGTYESDVELAKKELTQAQSEVDNLIKRYENYSLIANFAGKVSEAKIQVGDTVNTNSNTYIYIENPNLIEISLNVEQNDILELTKGDPVEISLDIYPGDVFTGIISEISTVQEGGMGTYTAKVAFQKPEEVKILGGMSATITYTVSQKKNVILVPTPALNMSMETGMFTVTMQDGSEREVEVGDSDMFNTEIISGLEVGETILSITIAESDLMDTGISGGGEEEDMMMYEY